MASTDSYFVTYRQAQEMGGNIKKRAKSIPIVYWNVTDREVVNKNTGNSEVESIPFMKYYRVFGISQTEGLEEHIPAERDNPENRTCEELFSRINPAVEFGGRPSHYPIRDIIQMPKISEFQSSEDYYSTFFHERAIGPVTKLDWTEKKSPE